MHVAGIAQYTVRSAMGFIARRTALIRIHLNVIGANKVRGRYEIGANKVRGGSATEIGANFVRGGSATEIGANFVRGGSTTEIGAK
jgi:hypothetical protein